MAGGVDWIEGMEGLGGGGSKRSGFRRGGEGCWWMRLEERKGAVRGARNHGGSVYTLCI